MIKKAIIPCAGMGTRFLPATKVIPKELFPIIDKPITQLIAEELSASGVSKIIFIINKEKESIRKYYSKDRALEKFLKQKGKIELLKEVEAISKLAKFSFVYQFIQDLPAALLLLRRNVVLIDSPGCGSRTRRILRHKSNFPVDELCKPDRFFEFFFRFSRETDYEVGPDCDLGCLIAQFCYQIDVIFLGVPAIHPLEYFITSRLDGNVDEPVYFLVSCDFFDQLIMEIPRIAG